MINGKYVLHAVAGQYFALAEVGFVLYRWSFVFPVVAGFAGSIHNGGVLIITTITSLCKLKVWSV